MGRSWPCCDRLEAQRRFVAAGTDLVHERQVEHHAFILEEGWACSYKLLPDGGRQVIDFPIPGDVIGVRSGWPPRVWSRW